MLLQVLSTPPAALTCYNIGHILSILLRGTSNYLSWDQMTPPGMVVAVQDTKPLSACLHPTWVPGNYTATILSIQLLAKALRKAEEDGSNAWACAAHVGGIEEAPGLGLA